MGREMMPIGTIRHWANGDVIKGSPNSLMHSGWIPLQTSEVLEEIGRDCDRKANSMIHKKTPISGELFLDREINEFEKDDQGNHPFNPNDFKQYKGFYGAGSYSFRNEFSKRYMADKIKLHDDIHSAWLTANAVAGGYNIGDNKKDVLSSEEKKSIRRRIERDFKYNEKLFTADDARNLQGIVSRTYAQLMAGVTFPDDSKEKEVYDNAIKVADSFPIKYERIGVKRALKEKTLAEVNDTFKDNWGVRESVKRLLEDKYGEYVRKFKKQISDDEAKDQEATFGVKLDDEPEVFYKALFKKVKADKEKLSEIDLNKYVGQEFDLSGYDSKNSKVILKYQKPNESGIAYWTGKFEDYEGKQIMLNGKLVEFVKDANGKLYLIQVGGIEDSYQISINEDNRGLIIRSINHQFHNKTGGFYVEPESDKTHRSEEEYKLGLDQHYITGENKHDEITKRIMSQIQSKEQTYPFQELIYLRFETLYNKQLAGDWNIDMLPVIYNIEKFMNSLPAGHFKTNQDVTVVSHKDFGSAQGYAFYSEDAREISFSKDAANAFQIWGDLKGEQEFNSTCSHEIGHAVSRKFRISSNLDYKKFVVACGWSYQMLKLSGEHATGNDKDIYRNGTYSMSSLLTDYAHKAPEEAFAEYYSIYANNREAIDKWLDNDNPEFLKKKSQLVVKQKKKEDEHTLSFFYNMFHLDTDSKVDSAINNLNIDLNDHVKMELINPWHVKYNKEEEIHLNDSANVKHGIVLARHLELSPIIVVKNKLNQYSCIKNGNINEGCKFTKKFSPAIIISEELYHSLQQKFDERAIFNYISNHLKDEKVPVQDSQPIFKTGLEYRNDILDVKDIVINKERLMMMRGIFNSKQLQKALSELFSFDTIRDIFGKPTLITNELGIEEDIVKAKINSLVSELEECNKEINSLKDIIDN